MTEIDSEKVVVYSYTELKNTLEGNNTFTYIFLGDNITFTGGINILNTKLNITIDGTYDSVRHTFTEMQSLAAANTINVTNGSQNIKLCNMDIVGYNYYGPVYVPDSATYASVVLEYNNIKYTGPQITFNATGLSRYIDVNVTINDNSLTSGNEIAECNKIEIGGNSTFVHNSKGNSAFWFRNSVPTFTILENAVVNFTSPSRELFYGTNELILNINENSKFYVTAYNGLAYGTFGTKSITVKASALFSVNKTSSYAYPMINAYGSVSALENSSLILSNENNTSSANYNIYFRSSGSFVLDNPKLVLINNKSQNIIYTASSSNFYFNFSRVFLFNTYFNKSDDITLNSLPTYSWFKNSENSVITGTFTNAASVISSNNFTQEELQSLPSLTNFIFTNKKAMSIGTTELTIGKITDLDSILTGTTNANASNLIQINNQNLVSNSSSEGLFSSEVGLYASGTLIKVITKMQNNLIYNEKSILVQGNLYLKSVSENLDFSFEPISLNPLICPRNSDLQIEVIDTRVSGETWNLYAIINHDLQNENELLNNSLVFIDENSGLQTLSSDKVLIATGKLSKNVTFDNDKGILLSINNPIINNLNYTNQITFIIE